MITAVWNWLALCCHITNHLKARCLEVRRMYVLTHTVSMVGDWVAPAWALHTVVKDWPGVGGLASILGWQLPQQLVGRPYSLLYSCVRFRDRWLLGSFEVPIFLEFTDFLFPEAHKVLFWELIYELMAVVEILSASTFLLKWRTPSFPTVWHPPEQWYFFSFFAGLSCANPAPVS